MNKNECSHTQRREFIKYQLRLRGTCLAQVGRELGVSNATMSQVCLGVRRSERVLDALTRRLGLPAGALDPETAYEEITM